jgi:hypothetical protein
MEESENDELSSSIYQNPQNSNNNIPTTLENSSETNSINFSLQSEENSSNNSHLNIP